MASGGGRLAATPQPSTAFLLKCIKEQEKLRLTFQKQLQQHMLDLFEGGLFADLELKGALSEPCVGQAIEGKGTQLYKVHKAIIEARTPSFHEHVRKLAETSSSQVHLPSLEDFQLSSFLRKIYSEDEIKSFESEVVKQIEKRPEPEGHGEDFYDALDPSCMPVNEKEETLLETDNKEGVDVPHISVVKMEDPESVKDVADDISLPTEESQYVKNDTDAQVSDLLMSNGKESSMPLEDSSTSVQLASDPKTSMLGNEVEEKSAIDTDTYDIASDMATAESIEPDRMSENSLDMSESEDQDGIEPSFPEGSPMENSHSSLGTTECQPALSEDAGILAHIPTDLDSSLVDDNDNLEEKETPETPSQPSSMVRSGTFDLQCQMPLEKALESDEQNWKEEENEREVKQEDDRKPKQEDSSDFQETGTDAEVTKVHPVWEQPKDTGQSFYLHFNPPVNKADWLFQHSSDVRSNPPLLASGEAPAETHFPGHRLDGSMTDSGFLSQSASVLSETGLPSSLSSSVVATDNTLSSPSLNRSKGNAGGSNSKSEPIMQSPGSLFSYYIDMNNLPCDDTKDKAKTKKQKNSQNKAVYMYIDASEMSKKDSELSGLGGGGRESPSKSDVEDSLDGIKPGSRSLAENLMACDRKVKARDLGLPRRAHSEESSSSSSTKPSRGKQRPQSCYMFIDFGSSGGSRKGSERLESVAQLQHSRTRKRSPSVSMYVDLGKDLSKSAHAGGDSTASQEKTIPFRAHSLERTDFAGMFPVTFVNNDFSMHERWKYIADSHPKKTALHTSHPDNLDSGLSTREKPTKQITGSASNLQTDDPAFTRVPVNKPVSVSNEATPKKSAKLEANLSSGAVSLSSPEINFVLHETSKKSRASSFEKFETKPVKPDFSTSIEEEGLLPMSPILRRKNPPKKVVKAPVEEVIVKVSTRPQDIYAMTFRRPQDDDDNDDLPLQRNQSKDSEGNTSDNISSQDSIEKLSNPECDDRDNETSKEMRDTITSDPKHVTPIPPMTNPDDQFRSGNLQHGGQFPLENPISQVSHSPLPRPVSCDTEDDTETVYSEVSDISASALQSISSGGGSMTQSKERQSPDGDSGHDSSFLHRTLEACSKLGEDLLRMFLEEISTDVVVQVEGHNIKAHKCILASRCKYFAAMLKGDWLESSGNVINLQGFSYSAVHFALCHIYSGAISVPKDVNIAELALISDMLALDSLKEVVAFHLKMNYCHFFHKPCNHCIVGVVECLPLTSSCGLTGLHDKALRWIGKYFVRVWPSKAFVSLTEELMEQCYLSTKQNVSVESVIEMTLSCDRLMATLPRVKWAEPVFGLATKLLEECIHFMAQHFDQILGSDGFLALGKGQSWNVTALEENILSAVEALTPDVACKTYVQLGRVVPVAELDGIGEYGEWTQNFLDMLKRIHRQCERFLIHNANRVVHCQSWALLAPEVQRRIKDAAVIVFEFEKPTAPPPRLSSLHRKAKKQQETERPTSFEKSFTFPNKSKLVKTKPKTKSPSSSNVSGTEEKSVRQAEEDKTAFSTIEVNKTITKETKSTRLIKSEQIRIEQTQCHPTQPKTTVTTTSAANPTHFSTGESGRSHDIRMQAELSYQRTLPASRKTMQGVTSRSETSSVTTSPQEESKPVQSISEGVQTGDEEYADKSSSTCTSVTGGARTKSSQNLASLLESTKESQQGKEDKSSSSSSGGGGSGGGISSSRDKRKMKLETTSVSLRHSPKTSHSTRSSQVAKVPPFTYKTDGRSPAALQHDACSCHSVSGSATPRSISSMSPACTPSSECSSVKRMEHAINAGDLVAEIDAESSLVNHCLQEAELLEQELTRKLQRQQHGMSTRVWGSESRTVFSSTGSSSVKLHSESTSRITRPLQRKSATSVESSRKIPLSVTGSKVPSGRDVHGSASKSDGKGVLTRPSISRSRLSHQRHVGNSEVGLQTSHCTHRTSGVARASSLGRSRSGSTTPRRVGSATSLQLSSSSESRMTKSAGNVWK